ncbi:GNAT family N-acetyltransferase [Streptomyces sp. NPDC004031]
MAITITRMAGDYDRAVDEGLRALLVEEDWASRARVEPVRGSEERLYVALDDHRVVGFVEGHVEVSSGFENGQYPPPRGRIVNLLVVTAHRRSGTGAALVRRFAADCAAAGCDSVVLFPNQHRPAGRLAFFSACGFLPISGSAMLGATTAALTERVTPPPAGG